MSESHLAGAPVHVDGCFLRQLCQWCGYRLIDVDVRNIATESSSADRSYPEWEVGAWIQVDGSMRRALQTEEGKMPSDSCMRDVSPLLRAVEPPCLECGAPQKDGVCTRIASGQPDDMPCHPGCL